MNSIDEKRMFQRISFNSVASLDIGDANLDCQIKDLSLKGALIELKSKPTPAEGAWGKLTLDLGTGDNCIFMDVQVIRVTEHMVGLSCIHIDIESISHLRRLIELNTGDSDLLDRELQMLFQPEATH